MVLDTEYLKLTVGDALTRGCAATATVRPADSVEYLAKWLHKYVKNESIKEKHFAEKEANEATEAAVKAEIDAAESLRQAKHTAMVDAVDSLTPLVDDPFVLFGQVAQLVEAHTSAGMAYVGSLQGDRRELPELPEEDDGEDAEEPEEDVGEEAEPEAAAEGEEGESADPFNYKAKHFSYVSSSVGAEFMVGKELRRPAEAGEEEADAAAAATAPEKPGVTFDILDQAVPVVDVPNVLYRVNDVRFFKPVPRVGAYYAQALCNAATGEVKAVVAADTTITLGKGKPFTPDDKKFIGELAGAVNKCLQAMDDKLGEYVVKATEAHAPPPPPEEGAEGAEGAEAPAAAEEAPAAAEGEEGGEGEEAAPVEETAAEKLVKAKAAVAEAAAAVAAVKAEAISVLKLYRTEPAATGALLRGVVVLLANSTGDAASLKWPELRAKVLADPSEFFDAVAAYDVAAVSDDVAAFLRRSYFPLKARELWKESPLGVPLKKFVVKARAAIKSAAAAAAAAEEEAAAAAAAAAEAEAAPVEGAEGEEGAAAEEEPAPEA